MRSPIRVELWRDNALVETFGYETQLVHWVHNHHSYSLHHAVQHEGYAVRYVFSEDEDLPVEEKEKILARAGYWLQDIDNNRFFAVRNMNDKDSHVVFGRGEDADRLIEIAFSKVFKTAEWYKGE